MVLIGSIFIITQVFGVQNRKHQVADVYVCQYRVSLKQLKYKMLHHFYLSRITGFQPEPRTLNTLPRSGQVVASKRIAKFMPLNKACITIGTQRDLV